MPGNLVSPDLSEKKKANRETNKQIILIPYNIVIAKYLSAHLKFSMRLQWEAKNLNYVYNLM